MANVNALATGSTEGPPGLRTHTERDATEARYGRRAARSFGVSALLLTAMVLCMSGLPSARSADLGGDPGPEPTLCNAYNPIPPCYFKPGFLNFSLDHHLLRIGDVLAGTFTYTLPSQGHGEYKGYAFGTAMPQGRGLKLLGCTGVFAEGKYLVRNLPDEVNKGVATCRWKAVALTSGWSLDLGFVLSYSGSQPYESGDYYAVVGKSIHAIEGYVTDTVGDRLTGLRIKIFGPKTSTAALTNNAGAYHALVPVGSYSVNLQPGAKAERYFDPLLQKATVAQDTTSVRVDFVGTTHTDLSVTPATATDTGIATAKVVARALSPLDQPIPYHILDIYGAPGTGSHAAMVMCSIGGSQQGRVEPSYLRQDAPQYLSLRQTTDGQGALTYQVFFGTVPGRVMFRVDDPSVAAGKNGTDTRAYTTVDVDVSHTRHPSTFPGTFTVLQKLHLKSKVLKLSIDGTLAAIVQGLTTGAYPPSPVNVSSGGDAQRNLLRAIDQSELFKGYGMMPISGIGGGAAGVLLYAGDNPDTSRVTRVLDLTTAKALQSYDLTTANTTVNLPTRAEWESQIVRGTTVLDFASSVPEKGLTYVDGLPYLPATDADLGVFDGSCLSRATATP
jgi:hypothetical protein